jgi:enamine deaminase RidA (YjgF/YER057c/UK114 family)
MGQLSSVAPEARVSPYLWYGEEIRAQTDYTLQKLQKIAESAGTSLEHTVKATVYLPDPSDFPGFEDVWKNWFPENPPARVVIPYMGLGGKGCRIEIALKILMPNAKIKKETIETSSATEPATHEPQAVRAGDLLFLSGQMAVDEKGKVAEDTLRRKEFPYYGSPPKNQMNYILENVNAICEAAGTSSANIARRQCFHNDFTYFYESMEAWRDHFKDGNRPASTTLQIGDPLLAPGCLFLLDLIAYAPE